LNIAYPKAALRRARDEVTCGSSEIAEREAEKAAKEGIESKVIDLTQDSDSDSAAPVNTSTTAGPSKTNARKPAQKPEGVNRNSVNQPGHASTSSSRQSTGVKPPDRAIVPWTCEVCTLINDNSALQCAACMANPPRDPASVWFCLTCGAENENDFWMCKLCDSIKTSS
jgi:DNA-dependent metalloprotease WSS1